MGRLIDADVLMEYFKRLSDECSSENDYEYSNLYDCVCAKIMTQPTAYNVENVVEALEEQQEYYSFDFDSDLDCARYKAYKNAIDIVKRGGVENEYKREDC